jgi:hypothetical protein
MRAFALLFTTLSLGLVACDDGGSTTADAGTSADVTATADASGVDGTASGDAAAAPDVIEARDSGLADALDPGLRDAGTVSSTRCAAPASYGRATLTDAHAEGEGTAVARVNMEVVGQLNATDQLTLLLYADTSVFGPALAPGTYPLAGPKLNFDSCGLCLLLDAHSAPPNPPEMVYFPTGGTVELLEVGARFRATLRDATFEHITLDIEPPYSSRPVGDGCVTRIDELSIDVPVNR